LRVVDEFNSAIRLVDYSRAFSILGKFETEASFVPNLDDGDSDLAQVWNGVVSRQFDMRDTLNTLLPHILQNSVSVSNSLDSYSISLERDDGSLDAVIAALDLVPLIDLINYLDPVCKLIVELVFIPVIREAEAKTVKESGDSLLSISRVSGPSKWTLDSVIGLISI
jgi:hypothetical protein